MGGFIALRLSSYIYEGRFYVFQDILLMKTTHLQSKHSSFDYLGKYTSRCYIETTGDPKAMLTHKHFIIPNDVMSPTTAPNDMFQY